MAKEIYTIEYIKDYQNRLTDEQKKKVVKHCNRYEIKPNICAWYDDWEDFCEDWCNDCGYSRTEARQILNGGVGEFLIFPNKEIIRFTF